MERVKILEGGGGGGVVYVLQEVLFFLYFSVDFKICA